jgi:hypothetical protein
MERMQTPMIALFVVSIQCSNLSMALVTTANWYV